MVKISVLMPVYNVEKYVAQAIESVIQQSFDNFEFIIADDGSTDMSGKICDEFACKDSRIRVIHKNNEGLLLTRRFLINQAEGEYILFIDSDDYWEKDTLSSLNELTTQEDPDLIFFGFQLVDDQGNVIIRMDHAFEDQSQISAAEIYHKIITGSELNSIWSKLIRRNICDIETDYSIRPVVTSEDLLQLLPLLKSSRKTLYLDRVLYNYRMSTTGICRNYKSQYLGDYLYVRSKMFNDLNEIHYFDNQRLIEFSTYFFKNLFSHIKSIAQTEISTKEKKKLFSQTKSEPIFQEAKRHLKFNQLSTGNKLFYLLFNLSMYTMLIRMAYYSKKTVQNTAAKA